MKKFSVIFALIVVVGALIGCSGGGGEELPPDTKNKPVGSETDPAKTGNASADGAGPVLPPPPLK